MNHYTQVPFGSRSNSFEAVFLWIYAKNCTPYAGYELNKIPKVTLVLSQLRWDGMFGGIGGAVEKTDADLETAVIREAFEEVGYVVDRSRLKPLTTFQNTKNNNHIHSFSLEVTYEELLEIRNNAHKAEHFSAECAGVNLMHFARYLKGGRTEAGFCNLMDQNFICTSQRELEILADKEDLIVDYTKYTLFLDDLRDANKYFEEADNLYVCRTYKEAVALVEKKGLPGFVSFDHDLGDTENEVEEDGYLFAKYLVQYMMDNEITTAFEYQVHSANPIGAENITSYLNNWFRVMGK